MKRFAIILLLTIAFANNKVPVFALTEPVDLASGTQVNIDTDQSTAFGEVIVAENTPLFQPNFVYGVIPDYWTISTRNSLAGSAVTRSMIQLSTGATGNSSYDLTSKIPIKYASGQGGMVRFTFMVSGGGAGSHAEIGINNNRDGMNFLISNNVFCVQLTAVSVNTIITQGAFNVDKLDGTGSSGMILDFTKLNVGEIKYQYLGAGEIRFSIENTATGKFIAFHKIKYSNTYTQPSLGQPTLPFNMHVENNATATNNMSLFCASLGGFIEGKNQEIGLTNGTFKSKTLTTEAVIVSIRNNQTFSGVTNYNRIKITNMTFASDGTKSVNFKVYRNSVLGGSPVWSNVSTANSFVAVDTAGTLTSGTLIGGIALAKVSNEHYGQEDFELYINPGEILTVTGTSAASNDTDVSIVWKEIF